MERRSKWILACALLLTGWVALRAGLRPEPAAGVAPAAARDEAASSPSETEREAHEQRPRTPSVAAPSPRTGGEIPAGIERLRGRVVLPPDTPADERVEVLAAVDRRTELLRIDVLAEGTFTLELTEGEQLDGLELVLRPAAVLTVEVTRAGGGPDEGASVQLRLEGGGQRSAVADERGRAVFDDLPPGTCTVRVVGGALLSAVRAGEAEALGARWTDLPLASSEVALDEGGAARVALTPSAVERD